MANTLQSSTVSGRINLEEVQFSNTLTITGEVNDLSAGNKDFSVTEFGDTSSGCDSFGASVADLMQITPAATNPTTLN